VDSCGCKVKLYLRKRMLAKWRKPVGEEEDPEARERFWVRTVEDAAEVLKEINDIDLGKALKAKEDVRGARYIGLRTELVLANDVATPSDDWKTLPGTHQLHQVSTTSTPGLLLTRKRSCFLCPACDNHDFSNCTRTDDLGPVEEHRMVRLPSFIAAPAETEDSGENPLAMASLATKGSVVAVELSKKLSVVLVTTPLGGGHFNDEMKGKLLMPMEQSNCFSTAKAKPRTFSASLVRSSPLTASAKEMREGQKKYSVFEITDSDFLSLRN
jgi:hypothetical protein